MTIKVSDSELLQSTKKKNRTYKEQSFRITIDTSFEMLRDMACEFWAMNRNDFSLYDHQFGHLMALNAEVVHPVHKVSNYFEALKQRYPLLYLLKDNKEEQ